MSCAAIIVAAGRGRRMGFDKLLAPLCGKPVLQWSLDACLQAELVDAIVIVSPAERFAVLETGAAKPVVRVDGDRERFLSVVKGLDGIPHPVTYVAIHDGARPLVLPSQIDACLRLARDAGAAALARRVTETLKRGSDDLFTRGSVQRENVWIMETPQAFRFKMLRRAYAVAEQRRLQVTDDVSAAEAIGVPSKLIENPHPNLKITFPRDLAVVEALMMSSQRDLAG
jgi:2-C-methyl-D-erythritol 4-phosphate cytidylyltransferase